MLQARIEPTGASAERAVAALCADGSVARDREAMLGAPAAQGPVAAGDAAMALLVKAAAHSLDDTDLRITLHRG
jgi:hypothetical protein